MIMIKDQILFAIHCKMDPFPQQRGCYHSISELSDNESKLRHSFEASLRTVSAAPGRYALL